MRSFLGKPDDVISFGRMDAQFHSLLADKETKAVYDKLRLLKQRTLVDLCGSVEPCSLTLSLIFTEIHPSWSNERRLDRLLCRGDDVEAWNRKIDEGGLTMKQANMIALYLAHAIRGAYAKGLMKLLDLAKKRLEVTTGLADTAKQLREIGGVELLQWFSVGKTAKPSVEGGAS